MNCGNRLKPTASQEKMITRHFPAEIPYLFVNTGTYSILRLLVPKTGYDR